MDTTPDTVLSREQVEHIATLARVGLTSEDVELMRTQLSSILAHVDQLAELDTDAIAPTAQVITQQESMDPANVGSADEPVASFSVEVMLENAPDREGNYFKVPSVLGYET